MTDLKIYWSNLTPTRNAWVDDIEDYLSGLQVFYHCEDFQYQRFANELEIVIPVPQADLSQQEVGNYVRIYQDNIAWYYFVMSYKWTSKNSLRLSLSIDSVNTFVGTHVHFSPKTVIERQHKDRYVIDSDFYIKRVIKRFDPENEEIPINQENVTTQVIKQQDNSDLDWFLIYKTAQDASIKENNPVSCYCIANKPLVISKSGGGASQTLHPTDLPSGQYSYVLNDDNPNFSLTINWHYIRYNVEDTRKNLTFENNCWIRNLHYNTQQLSSSRYAQVKGLKFVSNGTDINVLLYLSSWTYTAPTGVNIVDVGFNYSSDTQSITINSLNFTRITYDGNIPFEYAQQLITDTQVYNIGSQVTRLTMAYSALDKTDSKIIKIIRLPYAPCTVTYNIQGVYIFPNEWEYESGYMKLNDASLSTEFESNLDRFNWLNYLTNSISHTPRNTDSRLSLTDPKIETSQFSTYKFLYDSFSQEVKLERLEINGLDGVPYLPIKFKPTNTINSRFAFKLDWGSDSSWNNTSIKTYADYENYLLVNRNNEETIFSSDYLNYLRNGYNYDKKVKNEQSVMNYVMGGLQTVGAIVSFAASAFTGGASVAAGIALTTGAITTFTSAAYQQHSNEQAISQKLKNLQMQSVGVSGSDDVDLLKYYNNNKLYFSLYRPLKFQIAALNNLFFYCGYKHKAMEVPNTTSRLWFNFIQCKPVFIEEEGAEVGAVYNKFWDDIKTRFIAGVTRYHRVNGSYDWAQEKENWEVNLLNFYDISEMSSITWSSEHFPHYDVTTFSGSWNGPTLNNTTQYIEVKFYDTEADWDASQPNETDTAIVQANKTFSIEYRNQGIYAVSFRVVNSNEPEKSSAIKTIYPIL